MGLICSAAQRCCSAQAFHEHPSGKRTSSDMSKPPIKTVEYMAPHQEQLPFWAIREAQPVRPERGELTRFSSGQIGIAGQPACIGTLQHCPVHATLCLSKMAISDQINAQPYHHQCTADTQTAAKPVKRRIQDEEQRISD